MIRKCNYISPPSVFWSLFWTDLVQAHVVVAMYSQLTCTLSYVPGDEYLAPSICSSGFWSLFWNNFVPARVVVALYLHSVFCGMAWIFGPCHILSVQKWHSPTQVIVALSRHLTCISSVAWHEYLAPSICSSVFWSLFWKDFVPALFFLGST